MYDNLVAHPNPLIPDPNVFLARRDSISFTLRSYGFDLDVSADIPSNLSDYAVVVVDATFACEPVVEPILRSYVANGGGVILRGSAPCYLSSYCKNFQAGTDLTPIQEWLGATTFGNIGGSVHVCVDHPFNTSLVSGDTLMTGVGSSSSCILDLHADTQVMAVWETGEVFAFTHEYGEGWVYFIADLEVVVHDVAIRSICLDKSYVIQGTNVESTILIANEGSQVETLSMTIYANTTLIANLTDLELDKGTSQNISFSWNTTGWQKGKYLISAQIAPVIGEMDEADNVAAGTWLFITIIPGDVNYDGKVDLRDVYAIGKSYSSVVGDTRYKPELDLNYDGKIDLKDYYVATRNFGRTE
jgi:hypothetical protein